MAIGNVLSFLVQTGSPYTTDASAAIGLGPLDNAMYLLNQFGFFRVVLPFLLVFALTYAVLLKTKILGDPNTQKWVPATGSLISLAIAFIFITYTPAVSILATLLPQASFLLIVMMLLLMMVAFFGLDIAEIGKTPKWYHGVIVIVLAIVFLGILDVAAGWQIPVIHDIMLAFLGQQAYTFDEETMNTLIGLAVVLAIPIAVVAVVVWSSRPGGEAGGKKPAG